ncbi:hypothetical protein WR25_17466 [Diploscapter pachys]|uniref:ShKT domain-containing protein n=1 Tax=Diploscapter pachys TaxID=2018661 RepID=A0A2A2K719_9BILA|nr:hypothetical protein WR25_17466 [Diploscapter pachys]
MIYLLFILSLATVAYSQTCSDGGQGPCVGGSCSPGFTCIQDGSPDGLCCSDANVVTTTIPPVTTTTIATTTTTTIPGQTTTTTVAGQTTTTIPGQTTTTVAGQTTTTGSGTCVDKLNPNTGVSDCPSRANLCNDSQYYALMTDQCPKTCGRCGASGTTTAGSTCVDKVNPNTGVSDCPSRAS